MEIIKCTTKEECYIQIADLLASLFKNLLSKQESIIFGIPGGRNVSMIFQELSKKNIDWSKIHIFMVDERMVSLDSDDSNYKLAYDSFLKNLIDDNRLSIENIHPFKIEEGIDAYTKELEKLGGKYDIALLSSGEDGHIAALYPNHHSIVNESDGFISMDDSPKMPPSRMTMSKNMILNSENAILMFIGDGKSEALTKFNDDSLDYREVPAKLVKKIKDSYVFTDL